MQLLKLFQLLTIATSVQASGWTVHSEAEYAATGCKTGLGTVANFCGTPEAAKTYKCICKNKNALTSWMNCGSEYFPHISKEEFDEQIIDDCKKTSNINQSNLTEIWEENSGKLVDINTLASFNKTSPKFPIRGASVKKAILGGYHGEKNRWEVVNVSHYLGISFVAATGLILIVTGMLNWLSRLSRAYANSGTNALQSNLRKHLTLGIFPRHLQASKFGGGVNPDKLEAFFITIMIIYSILANFILGYSYYQGDLTFATKRIALARYFGDRSCILLSYKLPLLFLFPGRNNFFQYVTRWKQSRFLTFHKWIARIVVAETFIHTVAMAVQTYSLKKYTRLATPWYRYGIVSTLFFCLIPVLALPIIRRKWYEFFLVVHIVFAASAIWTAFLHAKSQLYQQFYWAAIAIWIFDRVVRMVRIVLTGGVQTVEIEYFEVGKALKISIPDKGMVKAHPGSHAFIHFLTLKSFWQSHPFTAYPSGTKPGYIVFNCRVKKGITEQLAERCKANGNKINLKIAIDGFYAEENHYHFFDKSVFISSGTGFAGPYFYAKHLAEKLPNHEVKFYFSARNFEEMKEYLAELLVLKDLNVTPTVYIAQSDSSSSGSGSSDDNDNKESIKENTEDDEFSHALEKLNLIHGRLPVIEVIDQETIEATGSVAFGLCANPQLVDIARSHIANNLTKSSKRIEYFEEMQMW